MSARLTTTSSSLLPCRVLLLGSGELGKELAIALARLGVEVHAADSYAGAPAHHVSRGAYVVDMSAPRELAALIAEVDPDFVVPEIEATATEVLQEVEERGKARVVPNARAVRLTMDRQHIRSLAAEQLGLPTGPYAFAASVEELAAAAQEVGFPCVVKPVMSSSGKGQMFVRGADEVEEAWGYARAGARVDKPRVIVEGVVDFDFEVTLLTVRSLDPATGQVRTDVCPAIGHRQSGGDYVESWQPAAMSQAVWESARRIAVTITEALGGVGLFGVELFVVGQRVLFSEVSPRPHDTGMVTLASMRFSEFDLHARALLGLPVEIALASAAASAVIRADEGGEDPRYDGLARALGVPGADVRIFGKPLARSGRRMGVALATGSDVEEARGRAREAAAHVRVLATRP